jgi:1-acyl-sn-glycerol-3-phosphate acyltransferase
MFPFTRRDPYRPVARDQSIVRTSGDGEGGFSLGALVHKTMLDWTLRLGGKDLEGRLARLAAPQNEYGVDPFGLDLEFTKAAIAPAVWLYKNYFRVETHDIHHVPAGRVLLIANHSGQLPLDGAMLAMAMVLEAEPPRITRAMAEKWVPTLPFIAPLFARVGQVVGTPENCRRLLAAGEAVMVFPEGVRGIAKLYKDRYKLQEFPLGFMRLALETQTPIVPVAVIGAEEQAPSFYDFKALGKLLGMPAMPITPTGLVPFPLPVKYRIYFAPPLRFSGAPDEDDAELEKKVRQVKDAVAGLIERGLRERKSVFF